MEEKYKKWLEFLNPDSLKERLISISVFVATFESFNHFVVEQVRFFFNTGFDESGYTFSPEYKVKVLSKDKNQVNASLKWLKELGAIQESDIITFHEIRKKRNKLVHEMMDLITEGLEEDMPELFVHMIDLKIKIEKWWIINVELPTSGQDSDEINEDDIITSSQMFNRLILDMISGDEKKANFYRKEFMKSIKNDSAHNTG